MCYKPTCIWRQWRNWRWARRRRRRGGRLRRRWWRAWNAHYAKVCTPRRFPTAGGTSIPGGQPRKEYTILDAALVSPTLHHRSQYRDQARRPRTGCAWRCDGLYDIASYCQGDGGTAKKYNSIARGQAKLPTSHCCQRALFRRVAKCHAAPTNSPPLSIDVDLQVTHGAGSAPGNTHTPCIGTLRY